MKEQAINKIHKMGHAGQVITLICKILLIIGLVAALTGAIILARIPRGFFTVDVDGNAVMSIDLTRMGIPMTNEISESLERWSNGGNINIQGAEFSLADAEVTENGVRFTGGAVGRVFDLRQILAPILAACVILVAALVTIFFAGALCKALRYCVSPFEENVIKRIRHLAFSLIPWTVVSTLTSGMSAGPFTEPRFTLGIDLGMVIVVLIVLALAYIFQYGAMLQQESDETL